MLIVLDTNVLYQALRSKTGASNFILSLIREYRIKIAISIQIFNEYEDVLKRPKSLKDLKLSVEDIDNVLRFIAYIGKPFITYFLFRPNLRDENDNIFLELAIASNCNYLITSNIRDFTINAELKFDDLRIVTPAEFVHIWKEGYENKS